MRGTEGRGMRHALILGIALGVLPMALGPGLRADDFGPGPTAGDPVDLAADRIRAWDQDEFRYFLLEGRAAVLQGVDGLRAEKALVRTRSGRLAPGMTRSVEVYAEGQVRPTSRPGQTLGSLRLVLGTDDEVRPRPYTRQGLVSLPHPPGEEPMLTRGFPASAQPVPTAVAPSTPQDPALVRTQVPAPRPRPIEDDPSRSSAPEPISTTPSLPSPVVEPPPEGLPAAPDPLLPPEMAAPEPVLPEPLPGLLPEEDIETLPGLRAPAPSAPARAPVVTGPPVAAVPIAPVIPGSQRTVSIFASNGGPNFGIEKLADAPDGTSTLIVQGGVNLVVQSPKHGIADITADRVVIWSGPSPKGKAEGLGPNSELVQDDNQPLEAYLEGNVVIRQDERKVAGNGDQKTFRCTRAYYDFRLEKCVALEGEVDVFAPGLIAPFRVMGDEMRQFAAAPGGPKQIQVERSTSTGSRFANPGYRFFSRAIDLTQVPDDLREPTSGLPVGKPNDPDGPKDYVWRYDARRNYYYLGPVPIFFWPRVVGDAEEIDSPLKQLSFRASNVFGQQVISDWNGFKLLGMKRPAYIDGWNVDLDYLSYRGFAAGSEIGWFGKELIPNVASSYFGYLDIYGIRDTGNDVLGGGPAIIVDPPDLGKKGIQRTSIPPLVNYRGRLQFRHMQSLLGEDADPLEDFRLQLEVGYVSDRNFLEQYYKRLFDQGMDQATLAYLIRQRENRAFSVLVEGNLNPWYTESQWLPRFDYYNLGSAPAGQWLTYFGHSGISYSNTHTSNEVNNRNIFAYLPYDPVSNTNQVFRSGRAFTDHELDLPLNFDVVRFTPYVQGQLVGWDNQISGNAEGRAWGALGLRADMSAWKTFPEVESELLNIHGLAHKLDFVADYRSAFSSLALDKVGVQDDLDDNTYEETRRYFILINYMNGILPPQYDPRLLALRRNFSPITGTVDVQDRIDTLKLGLFQRLQTKRGPEGKRRIIDYMVLDLSTTYFPNADRDNFGKGFGQSMFNHEWYIGDRTSIVTNGWFESWNIGGQPLPGVIAAGKTNVQGIRVISSGVSLDRPPRGSIYLGYSIIDTGIISTSAINASYRYTLSPKWFTSFSTTYDFGNKILLGSSFSLTRIGADYLTTVGLAVDPQRSNYTFAFELAPRLSPSTRLGSGTGLSRYDPRFAPTQ